MNATAGENGIRKSVSPSAVANDGSEAPVPAGGYRDVGSGWGPTLAEMLGRVPTVLEARVWATMSPAQRAKASWRITLLRRWTGDRGDLTADTAASEADVSPKRFYEMASAWKRSDALARVPGKGADANVLSAVGSFGTNLAGNRPSRLDPMAVNALQAAAAKVVAGGEGRSVEFLRKRLEAEALRRLKSTGIAPDNARLPSKMIVRGIVERELDRVGQSKAIGSAVRMDHAAISLPAENGNLHIAFFVFERSAGMILGAALGTFERVVDGYAAAASNAVARLGTVPALSWARATSRIDIVRGEAREELFEFLFSARADEGVPSIEATGAGGQGRYLRQSIGQRIGRVYLRSARTISGDAKSDVGSGVYTAADALVRLNVEVDAHNRAVIDGHRGDRRPPANLLVSLAGLAGGLQLQGLPSKWQLPSDEGAKS